MSSYIIKLTDDDVIIAEDINLESSWCDIIFKIKQDGINTIDLQGLSFEFTLKKDEVITHEFQYPPAGVILLHSDMPYICTERVTWIPNESYTILIGIHQKGKASIYKTYNFLTPKGIPPYPSCKWNDRKKLFEMPVDYPKDGKNYEWDDRTRSWKSIRQYLSSLRR